MNDNVERIRKIQPNLIKRAVMGWLAISPGDSGLCVGVIGSTENDAREKFSHIMEKWADIFSQNMG